MAAVFPSPQQVLGAFVEGVGVGPQDLPECAVGFDGGPDGVQAVGGGGGQRLLLVGGGGLPNGALNHAVHADLRGAPVVVEGEEAEAAEVVQPVEHVLARQGGAFTAGGQVVGDGLAGEQLDRDAVRVQQAGQLDQRAGQAGRGEPVG